MCHFLDNSTIALFSTLIVFFDFAHQAIEIKKSRDQEFCDRVGGPTAKGTGPGADVRLQKLTVNRHRDGLKERTLTTKRDHGKKR